MASNLRILVASIDFGTTYSGWAFSFKHEYDADPTQVYAKRWIGGHLVSEKAPTIVLIKPDGKTLDSFGYEAESKYAELASEGNFHHEKWYYFRRFKMMLHERLGLTREIQLEDETNKKTLPAKTVFSLAIQYLKDDMLTTSRDRLTGDQIRENEITWVLTVPAIWNDAAKQFMREAALQAGIRKENLRIALEPETAYIYCRLLPVEKMAEGAGVCSFKPGSKYMVLDAGGGTVDITVHEVMPGGKLKELHKASGGAWGGAQVDEAYKQFLIGLVGNPVFQRFCSENKDDHLDMCRDFEIKKRDIAPDKDATVTIRLPSSLKEIFQDVNGEDLQNAIRQTVYAEKVSLMRDKLRVDASVLKGFFARVIDDIVSHVKELMKDKQVWGISGILMVGGFSESKMLQTAIRSEFPRVRIIVPQEAGLVVLKGAVVFGHTPSSIVQRVCKYTYGVGSTREFDNKIHDKSKLKHYDVGPRCEDIFEKHVEAGQVVTLYDTQSQETYFPLGNDQKEIKFPIYCSTNKSPMYTTDEGVMKIGTVRVSILDMSVPTRERKFLVSMTFSGTEIEVSAKEIKTGKVTSASVDFLG